MKHRLLVTLIAACGAPQKPAPAPARAEPLEPNSRWTISASKRGDCLAERVVACDAVFAVQCAPQFPFHVGCPGDFAITSPITIATVDGVTCTLEEEGQAPRPISCPVFPSRSNPDAPSTEGRRYMGDVSRGPGGTY